MIEIYKGVGIVDLGLYFKKTNTLVIGDLQIGYEASLNKEGVLVPRQQFDLMIKMLRRMIEKVEIKRIIVNGDIKHEFGEINEQEWREILNLLDFLKENRELILIKGNHDKMLEPIITKRGFKLVNYFKIGKSMVLHGDEIINECKYSNLIVIGHEHPAVRLKESAKVEMYKCFLKGKWKGKTLIVMPSFNPLVEGSDILNEERLSPFLKDNQRFHIFIVGDKVYDFGTSLE